MGEDSRVHCYETTREGHTLEGKNRLPVRRPWEIYQAAEGEKDVFDDRQMKPGQREGSYFLLEPKGLDKSRGIMMGPA